MKLGGKPGIIVQYITYKNIIRKVNTMREIYFVEKKKQTVNEINAALLKIVQIFLIYLTEAMQVAPKFKKPNIIDQSHSQKLYCTLFGQEKLRQANLGIIKTLIMSYSTHIHNPGLKDILCLM